MLIGKHGCRFNCINRASIRNVLILHNIHYAKLWMAAGKGKKRRAMRPWYVSPEGFRALRHSFVHDARWRFTRRVPQAARTSGTACLSHSADLLRFSMRLEHESLFGGQVRSRAGRFIGAWRYFVSLSTAILSACTILCPPGLSAPSSLSQLRPSRRWMTCASK